MDGDEYIGNININRNINRKINKKIKKKRTRICFRIRGHSAERDAEIIRETLSLLECMAYPTCSATIALLQLLIGRAVKILCSTK